MQIILLAVIMLAGVIFQIYNGYYNFEFGHYFKELFLLSLLGYLAWAFLSIFMQTLIGNPYLASVSVLEMLEETNNASLLSEQTVWLWDQSVKAYVTKNLVADLEVAPGQGFFVSVKTAGNFTLTKSMQSHAADTFQRSTNRPEINITMTNGTDTRHTDIFYIDGTTTGFDNGYDSSIFEGLSVSLIQI